MLNKFLKRCASKKIYSWGLNKHNCGYEITEEIKGNIPISLEINSQIKKSISGFSESVFLTTSGKVYQYGLDLVLKGSEVIPQEMKFEEEISDVDLDKSNSIYLTKSGKVYTQTEQKLKEIKLSSPARKVACGDKFSLAVCEEDGNDLVYMWGEELYSGSDFIFGGEGYPLNPRAIKNINNILKMENSKIKSISIVSFSAAMLLENGKLYTWGSNLKGNLGINRTIYETVNYWVDIPEQPIVSSRLNTEIQDFSISENIMVVLGKNGKVYYSGLDKDFVLEEVKVMDGVEICKVGAFKNNYALVSKDNRVFVKECLEDNLVKAFKDFGLFEVNKNYFEGKEIDYIGGKYENVSMLTQ